MAGNVNKALWEYWVGSTPFACDGDWVRRELPGTISQAEEHLSRNWQNRQGSDWLKKDITEKTKQNKLYEEGSKGEKINGALRGLPVPSESCMDRELQKSWWELGVEVCDLIVSLNAL